MARPYSLDLRERAVARVAAGETVRSVAAVLQVSVASVVVATLSGDGQRGRWPDARPQTEAVAAAPRPLSRIADGAPSLSPSG
jgi:transposase